MNGNSNSSGKPKVIILFSGKRKSGKDFITDKLYEKLGCTKCAFIKISAPIKQYWASENGLQFHELLSSGPEKEKHRMAMIEWSEQMRNEDPSVFCQKAIQMINAEEKPIWIVSDIRRKTDMKYFAEKYGADIIKLVRVVADDNIRRKRGWVYTPGIDDQSSECDLDDYRKWDWVIENNGTDCTNIDTFCSMLSETINKLI